MSFLKKLFGGASSGSQSSDAFNRGLDLWSPRYIKGNLISIALDREEIVGGLTERVETDVRCSLWDFLAGKRPLRTIHFFTNAYDKDKRALFQIPEMRQWCQILFKRIPHILFIIDAPTLVWFLFCLADVEVTSSDGHTVTLIVQPESVRRLKDFMGIAMNELFHSLTSTKPEFDQLI